MRPDFEYGARTNKEGAMTGTKGRLLVVATGGLILAAVLGHATFGQSQEPRRGGTLKVGLEIEVSNLDPATSAQGAAINMIQHVYNSLFRADANLNPVPDLVERWEAPNETTYLFVVRRGVKFHNGREMTADDVKYSFERMMDKKTGSPYAHFFDNVSKIEVPDKYTIRLSLKSPDASLLSNLTMPVTGIVPKEEVAKRGDLKTYMVGTGPFKFVSWVPNKELVLARNPEYFEKNLPYLDEIRFVPITDETARTAALRTGAVDFIDLAPAKDLPILKREAEIVITDGANVNYIAMPLNLKRKPFDNVKVRQAIAYAINREAIVAAAFDGLARPLYGGPLVPPYWAGAATRRYSYDVNMAKKLLAEAGYPNGVRSTLKIPAGYALYSNTAQAVQGELRRANINLDIVAEEVGIWITNVWEKDLFDAYIIRFWGIDYIDPDGAVHRQFHSKGAFNKAGYSSAKVDELIERANRVSNREERRKLYDEIQTIVSEEAPYVFLVSADRSEAHRSHVKGYVHLPNGSQYAFRQTWVSR